MSTPNKRDALLFAHVTADGLACKGGTRPTPLDFTRTEAEGDSILRWLIHMFGPSAAHG